MKANANGKRDIEVLDLTGSDDETAVRNQRRKAPRTDNAGRVYDQAQTINLIDDGEEADANELMATTQDEAFGAGDDVFELYGVLETKIVGVQYYTGYATIGEHAIIKREPTNRYDSNAIRVINVQRDQIGHIPRQVAAKLAAYMDAGDLLVDGTLTGQVGTYDCPMTVHLFGTSDPDGQEALINRMKADRLPVKDAMDRVKEAKNRRAAELKQAALTAKAANAASRGGTSNQQWDYGSSQGEYAGSSSQGLGELSQQSLEDIIQESEHFNPREMGQVVEKFGAGEETLSKMPMAVTPARLATSLLPYQRQGLAWLLEKENPQLPPVGSTDVIQLWKRAPRDPRVFTNIATNFSIKDKAPVLAKGGILADDMGLGKTLEVIALILADFAATPISAAQSSGQELMATLIVAPLSVMSNWSGQIAQHVRKKSPLRVLIYHGSGRRASKPKDLAEYDVVITTYGTLSAEYLNGNTIPPAIPRKSGLYSVKWRRIVLDEGHNIRNPTTKGAQAATNIMATNRWNLTGTPIINSLKDLYSMVRFIGLTGGLERYEVFNSVLIRPLKSGNEEANLLLQALMGTLCLRRRKDMAFIDLRLPKLSEYVHRIKFLPEEKEKYDALQAEAKGMLETFRTRSGKRAQEAYRHLLEILLRLRQICNHWRLCEERVKSLMSLLESEKVVKLTPENRKALQDMLQLSIESREDCPICLENLYGHKPVITNCAHVFGSDCITRVIETQHKCPMCRAELTDDTCLVQPSTEYGESAEQTIDFDTSSSKIEALLGILKASHRKAGTKIILFSQWTSFLDIVQKQLDEQGYGYTRIDGKMSAPRRDEALHALESDPDCTIMLASLGVSAVGLNLVAASTVILMDSWWAPAIEDQAIDRVHRLGQKKETTVFRLVMEGSIEERTLEIQAEKRKLMMTAFQEKSSKRSEGQTARLTDIVKLLE
ncbi:hypothetical protein MMC13_004242 [Lambiella insularis]|nr:hypothetical protein [Lambiella insularis]